MPAALALTRVNATWDTRRRDIFVCVNLDTQEKTAKQVKVTNKDTNTGTLENNEHIEAEAV